MKAERLYAEFKRLGSRNWMAGEVVRVEEGAPVIRVSAREVKGFSNVPVSVGQVVVFNPDTHQVVRVLGKSFKVYLIP